MKYEIQNHSARGKAFKVFGGTHEVPRGATEIVDVEGGLSDEQIEAHRRAGVLITRLDRKALAEREKAEREDAARAKAEEAARQEAERKAAEAAAELAKAEREALVAKAAGLKLEFPADIEDAALKALIAEAEAKAAPPPAGK